MVSVIVVNQTTGKGKTYYYSYGSLAVIKQKMFESSKKNNNTYVIIDNNKRKYLIYKGQIKNL